MVKRPKSPELVEDARYFTVYQPYPINANWILEEEQKKCAMWVAECIGLNYLWAIHYKPKARGMILLEVSKTFSDHGRFLGEHRWGDILKDPDELEKKSVTQVFHSFYSKGRDAQKDGWKAIPVQNTWFKGWMPGKGDIKRPYPSTHWCPVPVEDRTNKTLCRPLPSEQKPPPPPRAQQQVVGSSKWVEKQIEVPLTPSAMSNPWAKKIPSLDIPKANATAQGSRHTKSPSPGAMSPQSAGPGNNTLTPTTASGSKFPPTKNTRGKPVPLNAFISGETKTGKTGWAKPAPIGTKFSVTDPAPKSPANAWSKKLTITPSERTPKAAPTPTPYEMDYSAWTLPPSESIPATESPAANESSRLSEDPPPPKPNKGKGKEKEKGKQPAWKRNAQQPEETPATEPVYSLADLANHKPPTRAEVDATLRPWERGKVNYAMLGVVDAEPKPEPSITLDWQMDPPANDFSMPFVESSAKQDGPSSSSPNDKKRKPDGQFDKDGEPQYDKYGEPSSRYDSRKRGSLGSTETYSRTFESPSTRGSTSPDRGRGRGRGRERERLDTWEARRDARGPRYKAVGVTWYSGRKNEEGEAATEAGAPDTFKRPSHYDKPISNNWGDLPIKKTDESELADTFKYPSYYEKPIGTSWGDLPVSNTGESSDNFKYPSHYEKPIGTSWGDLPINNTDEPESQDWAADDNNDNVETEGGEWNEGDGEEIDPNAEPNEEPPNSDYWDEEGYEEGGEYGESNDYGYEPESMEGEPTAGSGDWGNGPAEIRGSNDWGLSPGEAKANPWGVPETSGSGDNPWASNPSTSDYSAWFADGKIPVPDPQWEKILEETLKPKRPQPAELICPTHNIACKKGICRDMARLIRERDMKQWMNTRGRGRGQGNGGRGWGDPRGPRGSWGAKELPNDEVVTYKRTRRGKKKNKDPPTIGVMRGFDDEAPAPADGVAASDVGTSTTGGHNDDDSGSDGGHFD